MTEQAAAAPAEETVGTGEEKQAPQRRREPRESGVSGTVTIEGRAFPLRNWSSSGFGIGDCPLELEANSRIDIEFAVSLETGPLAFSCRAIVVRSDPQSGELAGAFVEMRRQDRVAVTEHFESLETGLDGAARAIE